MATQGTPLQMNFDHLNANFESQFQLNCKITKPTVIYANSEYHYPLGLQLTIFDTHGQGQIYDGANTEEIKVTTVEDRISIFFKSFKFHE
jgi:hypothetical protein